MPTYISLINWTDQGIRAYAESVKRSNAANKLAQRMGGTIEHTYWTVGQYDIVTVADFPDDETAAAFLLALGGQGNIRSTTLLAHSAEDMTAIIGKVD